MIAVCGFEDHSYHLNNALYELGPASHKWHSRLDEFLIGLRFDKSKADPTLNLTMTVDGFSFPIINVDNVLILASERTLADKFVNDCKKHFKIKK